MTWKTSETCSHCGAQYEIDVWNLGHKDSDSIACQCCGEILMKWKNEARSYSIARQINPGNIKPKHEEIDNYKGKSLRFEKGATSFEGVVIGLGDSVMAISPDKVIRPWVIRTENEDIHLNPEDNWVVCRGKMA